MKRNQKLSDRAAIITPRANISIMKAQQFEVRVSTDPQWEWTTTPIELDFIPKSDIFPLALRTYMQPDAPPLKASIMFAKKLAFPELVILVWGLKDLVNVLPEASLLVIVEAHFCGYDFKIKKDSIKIDQEGRGQTEVFVMDRFLKTFVHQVGFRSHEGSFTLQIRWKHLLQDRHQLQTHVDNLYNGLLSKDIQAIEGTVKLKSSEGVSLKCSKGMLAACSQKFHAQFQSGMLDCANFTELPIYGHPTYVLDEVGLRAFVVFAGSLSVEEPLKSCSVAVDLLMAGQYNMIPRMESTMRIILLGQPKEWFDTEAALKLFWYTSEISATIRDKNSEENKNWERLKFKSLWILKSKPVAELESCELLKSLCPNLFSISIFTTMLSLFQNG